MIEAPLLKQVVNETRQESIVQFLESRFGDVPTELVEKIRAVADDARLGELTRLAARCSILDEFASHL